MIDPLNPGPAGSEGPAGQVFSGPTPQYVADSLQAGAVAVSDATAKILGAAQTALGSAMATIQSAIGKLAQAITTPLGAAQTTAELAQTQIAVAQAAQPAVPTGPTGSVPTPGATGPNHEEGWNLWSVRDADGWGVPIAEQYWTSYTDGCIYLFRGWALQFTDAVALAATLPRLGKDVRPECFPTIITPPTGTQPCPPGVQWAVWVFPVGTTGLCSFPYCNGLQPDPSGLGGSKKLFDTLDQATAFAASQTCTGIVPPTTGGPVYYGGCLSGKATAWDSTQTVPTGVTNVVGPFPDATSALAAAGQCLPIITPPTVSTGQCCGVDPATGALILPSCIKIDLCDWPEFCGEVRDAITEALNSVFCDPTCFVQPFCDCLKKTLCEVFSSKECASPFQDAERYIFEDQDETFAPDIQAWLGNLGSGLSNTGSLDDMAALPFGGK